MLEINCSSFMKNLIVLFLISVLVLPAYSQFKVTTPATAQLPKTISYKGNIVHTAQWKDSLGDNIMLLTETGIHEAGNEGNRSAALYALHYYVTKNDSAQLVWRVYDFLDDCPVDVEASFVKNTFAVTDLDHNGVAEIWMMYKITCQGDVSPIPMKIIMYQGQQKFAVRGNTKIKVSATETMGGSYTFDNAFNKAPAAFRQYADSIWQKHKMDKLQ